MCLSQEYRCRMGKRADAGMSSAIARDVLRTDLGLVRRIAWDAQTSKGGGRGQFGQINGGILDRIIA